MRIEYLFMNENKSEVYEARAEKTEQEGCK